MKGWLRSVHVGRLQLIVHVMNEKDRYGFEGSQGYSLRVTVVKNP